VLSIHVVRSVLVGVFAIACAQARADTVPFWGARHSRPANVASGDLKFGEYVWLGDAVQNGPMVMIVSIDEQRAYVYRNGILIGFTTVSTGRPGHETPTGVFTILQKDKDHRSTIYDSAPMPYMERLTWGGVALHAGGLPGYPESHGCVHLPSEFARLLFETTSTGMTVVIASSKGELSEVAHPGYLAPVSAVGGLPLTTQSLDPEQSMRWNPEAAPEGPVSIVLSRASALVLIYRAGLEIGRARLAVSGDEPIGTHALILTEGAAVTADRFLPDAHKERWLHVGIAGSEGESGTEPDPKIEARIEMPDEFVRKMYGVLTPGATVLVTDATITAATSGPKIPVVDADPIAQQ
jgi:L,D-transpeptidase catalytic domain